MSNVGIKSVFGISNTNRAVQLKKMARAAGDLKFWIKEEER